MSINELKNIIQSKKEHADSESIFDPKEQISDYITLTNNLYEMVKNAIRELIDEGLVSLKNESIIINEESLGEYKIDSLSILFSNEKIVFKPVGTMLIGSKGRVDMVGPKGIERFTLIRKGVTSPSQLINVNVVVGEGKKAEKGNPKKSKKLTLDDWDWRLLPNDRNWTKFGDVTAESITDALARVING